MLRGNTDIKGEKNPTGYNDKLTSVCRYDDFVPVYLNSKCKYIPKGMVEVIREPESLNVQFLYLLALCRYDV